MSRVKQEVRARHADRMRALSEQTRLAQESLDAAVDLRIVSGALEDDIKAGTRMVEWGKKHRLASAFDPLVMTGAVGVWEVFRQSSDFPVGHYRPDPGTQGVRILKKDGTPSARFIPCQKWAVNTYHQSAAYKGFYPEGVIPPRNLELAKS